MITVEELARVVEGLEDSETIDLFKHGCQDHVGVTVRVMPGVSGPVTLRQPGGALVRVPVRSVRHVLRLAGAGV